MNPIFIEVLFITRTPSTKFCGTEMLRGYQEQGQSLISAERSNISARSRARSLNYKVGNTPLSETDQIVVTLHIDIINSEADPYGKVLRRDVGRE